MPYSSNRELPDSVRHVLPGHAQTIYQKAFNSAGISIKMKTIVAVMNRASRWHSRGRRSKEYAKGEDDKWHPKH